jgi:acyl-CoA hydrolase
MNYSNAAEAVAVVRPGHRVFVQGGCATPHALLSALCERAGELHDVELVHLHLEGPAPQAEPAVARHIRSNCLFVGANLRQAVAAGLADYTPVFLSEVPGLFRRGVLPIDVALVHVSPPDRHGYCSLGVSVDVAAAAVESARLVVAQVNPQMPRSHGDGQVHVGRLHALVAVDTPLPETPGHAPDQAERAIARHVAGLVDDGATLQLGIGAIPDAVLAELRHHKRLGVHTEMFTDALVDLVASGAVTGELKRHQRGKVVSGFVMGTRKTYDFLDDNPDVVLCDSAWVNDAEVIRQNPRVTAINSAIEVDLTGQVCADSIGTRQFSGVGGQMDFLRGASLSDGGKPIIALPSVTSRGESRLVAMLKPGAGVVTTRAHVHWLVTEWGVAQLYGKSMRQRAAALVAIAHPDHRAALAEAAAARFGGGT